MPDYRKILVAFDGLESGGRALNQAIALRKLYHSRIRVLTVLPEYEGDLELVGVRDIKKVLQGPEEEFVKAAEAIARECEEVITFSERCDGYENIVEVCEEEHCDLVVLGRRDLNRMDRIIMGRVIAGITGSKRDVLVVPCNVKTSFESVLLSSDGPALSESALDRAIHFARISKGTLTTVSVMDTCSRFNEGKLLQFEQMEKKAIKMLDCVREKAEKAGVNIETKLLRGNIADAIVDVAGKIKAHVIFMGSRDNSGIKKLIMGSVTENVIGRADCPVMVVAS